MAGVIDLVRKNPVRVRIVIIGLFTLLGTAVPSLAGIETNETMVGAVMAVLALVLGWDASTKVELPADDVTES